MYYRAVIVLDGGTLTSGELIDLTSAIKFIDKIVNAVNFAFDLVHWQIDILCPRHGWQYLYPAENGECVQCRKDRITAQKEAGNE